MSAINQTDCTNILKYHVQSLAGEIGERHTGRHHALQQAADYISRQWLAMGYEVERQAFKARGKDVENLQVTRRGVKSPDDIILVCAHYDSAKDCPGANDNASGIAALLELSRYFARVDPDRSVRFVALTNEKPPFHGTEKSGSWIYAHQARQRSDNIRSAVILESLGYYNNTLGSQLYPALMGAFYPKQANFVAMTSNLASMRTMHRFARCFKKHCSLLCEPMIAPNFLPWVKWSDNSPFWLNGYHAFMVSDTSLYRYPFYNSPRDTPEKIDYQCLTFVTVGLAETLEAYAKQRSKNPDRVTPVGS
ncbi:hypothetical protein Tel_01965 [Candidatus Tenderia electrophaga]|jgi:hypothetical protein|uniref:Peptidase M28 domain-containing protein n=1 Tax=Candidatus Tenderia electrophaga TaxID=1748243 RepID=A0A0S2TA52_9GAMM|nr:hypothetical protein Tel_01965 [Candidatus Tenderia electrophaga]